MVTTTLDSIVRNCLVKKGLPIHYYLQYIVYAKDCLREISMDDLQVVNTKLLPVDTTVNTAELPNDYLDYIEIGVKVGQNVKPLVETSKINPLQNRNSTLEPIPYGTSAVNPNNQVYYGYLYPFYWHNVTWNQYGENTGRLYGFGAGVQDDVFQVFPERNQIQLTENMSVDNIVLQYISDGTDSDAATHITPYAFETISNYILWQHKEANRSYNEGERARAQANYISSRQILRARLSDLNKEVLTRLFQKATYAAPKSL